MDQVKEAVIKAVVAAISVAGVVVVGQAVAWVRFSAADLPADQVVALIGRTELIAIGAVSLASFIVGGIIAAAAAFGLDKDADANKPETPYGLIVIVAVAAVVGTVMSELETWAMVLALGAIAVGLAGVLLFAPGPMRTTARARSGGLSTAQRWVGRVLPLVIAVAMLIAVGLLWDKRSWFPLLFFGVALFLGLLCFGIASKTPGFQWYGVAVFLSVIVFGAVVGIAKTESAPKAQPMAAIVKTRDGPNKKLSGIYVGETSNRLYYAYVETQGEPGEFEVVDDTGSMLWVSCDQVVTYGVGTLQPVAEAMRGGARTVLTALKKQPLKQGAPKAGDTTEEVELSGCKGD